MINSDRGDKLGLIEPLFNFTRRKTMATGINPFGVETLATSLHKLSEQLQAGALKRVTSWGAMPDDSPRLALLDDTGVVLRRVVKDLEAASSLVKQLHNSGYDPVATRKALDAQVKAAKKAKPVKREVVMGAKLSVIPVVHEQYEMIATPEQLSDVKVVEIRGKRVAVELSTGARLIVSIGHLK